MEIILAQVLMCVVVIAALAFIFWAMDKCSEADAKAEMDHKRRVRIINDPDATYEEKRSVYKELGMLKT